MPEDASPPVQAAIRTDFGAIFSRWNCQSCRTWLITPLSPGGGEKMSKHSVLARDVSGLLGRFAELMRKAATSDRLGLPDYRHPGGRSAHLLEFTGCCIPIAETKKLADKEPRISDAILDQLLSCSLSRDLGTVIRSAMADGAGRGVRRAGDRARRRRLNKLSCAGWIPHDRGFVSGLPHSKGRASVRGPAHNRPGGFPNRGPASSLAHLCYGRLAPPCFSSVRSF
jgi:hypothetical protein